MAGKKYQSCLVPFENEILTLRRKRPPMSFPKIAEYLKEKYQVSVRRQTIETFLKIRIKGFKPCKYAWNIEPSNAENQPTAEVPTAQKQSVIQTSKPVIEKKPELVIEDTEIAAQLDGLNMEFSENYNLHRLTKEEADALRQKLREAKLKKENQ